MSVYNKYKKSKIVVNAIREIASSEKEEPLLTRRVFTTRLFYKKDLNPS